MERAPPGATSQTVRSAAIPWTRTTGGPVPDSSYASSTPAPSTVGMREGYALTDGRLGAVLRQSRPRRDPATARRDGRAGPATAGPGVGRQRDRPRGPDDRRGHQPRQRAGQRRRAGGPDPRGDGDGLPRGRHAGARGAPGASVAHAVLHVRHARRGDDLDRLELRIADVLQQPRAAAEEHRDDVEVQLLELLGRQSLLDRAGATGDLNVLVARRRARLLER